jgi:hypothetical protein
MVFTDGTSVTAGVGHSLDLCVVADSELCVQWPGLNAGVYRIGIAGDDTLNTQVDLYVVRRFWDTHQIAIIQSLDFHY